MHEFSLVESLLDEVLHATQAHPKAIVREIRVQCGPLAGVETVLLETAFHIQAPTRLGVPCQLIIEQIPLRARCQDCHTDFQPTLSDFRCSNCGSSHTQVTSGDALILSSITLDDPPSSSSE